MRTEKQLKKAIKEQEKVLIKERGILNSLREELEDNHTIPSMQNLVGKCYKYRNSYGSDCSGWWRYKKVTGIHSGSYVETIDFQETADHRFEIKISEYSPLSCMEEECTEEEWNNAFDALMQKINQLRQ